MEHKDFHAVVLLENALWAAPVGLQDREKACNQKIQFVTGNHNNSSLQRN